MRVKFKKLHPNAILPKYSKPGDAGMDLTATTFTLNKQFSYAEYGTGLAVEIPPGHVGLVFPRSSIAKTNQTLANSVGVIDENFRGEIRLMFFPNAEGIAEILVNPEVKIMLTYQVGDRIAQLIIMPFPHITPEWADELSETVRGADAFGSSGK